MSNILIIKLGSLGDLIQANGAIKDIKENFPDDKVFLLTTPPYTDFMSSSPYLDGVLIDKRLPRWNLFYLSRLKKMLKRFSFTKVFDLQNSGRTRFYKKLFFNKDIFWSDSNSFLSKGESVEKQSLSVLDRMELQLKRAGISKTSFTKKPDLSWAIQDIQSMINKNFEGNYILIFPFCSPRLPKKKWPYYRELIELLREHYGSKYNIAIAPGPNEIEESKKFKASVILNSNEPLNISELISLIKNASYIIGNDTGPAHICSHLGKKGLVLFGSHTTPEKVSIESENFKFIESKNIRNIKVSDVFDKIKENLN